MAVRSLGWLGVRTPKAAAMTAFYRDVLQLEVILDRPSTAWFRLADGTEVHVYGPDDADHDFFGSSPVIGFAVDSMRAACAALNAAGIEFIYAEPQRPTGGRGSTSAARTATSTRSSAPTIWTGQQAGAREASWHVGHRCVLAGAWLWSARRVMLRPAERSFVPLRPFRRACPRY
ncbi:MAG: VOC family protein [Streptosporangiaceae bacterium]